MGKRGPARRIEHPIRCQHCREDIEACEGLYGDWMHTATRCESCGCDCEQFDGGRWFAFPETSEHWYSRGTGRGRQ